MNTMNLYQRMLAVQIELKTVAKNLTVSTGTKSSYKAVGEKDILDAVVPLEAKFGIYSYPVDREIIDSGDYEKEGSNGYKSLARYLRIRTIYRFVNVDNPEEHLDILSYADGLDTGDKATGKAMTYCDKYALMKAYKIRTGEDPDQYASEEYQAKREDSPSKQELEIIRGMIAEGLFEDAKLLAWYKIDSFDNLTKNQAKELIKNGLKRRNAKQASEGA